MSESAERLWMTVDEVLRIVDANDTRQDIERALIASLPSNGGPKRRLRITLDMVRRACKVRWPL